MGFFKPFTHHMNLGISGEWVHTGLLSNVINLESSLTNLYTCFFFNCNHFAVVQILPPLFCYGIIPPPHIKKNQFKVVTATQPTAVSFYVLLALLDRDWQMWHRKKLPQCCIFVVSIIVRACCAKSKSVIRKKQGYSASFVEQFFLSYLNLMKVSVQAIPCKINILWISVTRKT